MTRTKRILSIFLVVLMLFTSLPVNVFAEELTTLAEVSATVEETTSASEETTAEEEEIEYETEMTYTIDGIKYQVNKNGTVYVVDETDDMPERVVILSHLGEYPVTKISYSAFGNQKNLKEIVIPETVKILEGLSNTGLEKVEIKADYVDIDGSVFASSPFISDEKNWTGDHLIVGSCLIASKADGEIILGKEITSVRYGAFNENAEMISFLNENCKLHMISSAFPKNAVLRGTKGSTIEKYCNSFGKKVFEEICLCEGGVYVEESDSLCDGSVGYTAGVYCEKCQLWQSGHLRKNQVEHTDENEDRICDYCESYLEKSIIASGKAGDSAYWALDDEGTISFYGEGDLYSYSTAYDAPWYSYDKDGFIKKAIFGKGIVTLGERYFSYSKNLESVVIADTVKSINGTFFNCNSIKTVVMSDSVTTIGKDAFAYCYELESIYLPESLTSIGENAFSSCKALKEIIIPDGITVIENGAFAGCYAAETLKLPADLQKIGDDSFKSCTALKTLVIPDAVTHIGTEAFYGCKSLTDVKLSEGITGISASTFEKCEALTAITIPAGVKAISDYAFRDCTALNDIEFKNGYMGLGKDVFKGTAAYNNPDNIKDGILYIENCLIKEINTETPSLVLGPEITSIAKEWYISRHYPPYTDSQVKEVVIYNPECVFPSTSAGYSSVETVFKGLVGSTAEKYTEKFGPRFVPFCICDGTHITVPESVGHCDGTYGYTEGVWCEKCEIWTSGHVQKNEFIHIDEDEDLICDLCEVVLDSEFIAAGKAGDNVSWRLMQDGTLCIEGTGDMYASAALMNGGWYGYSEQIVRVEMLGGITSLGASSFEYYKNLTSVKLSPVLLKIEARTFYGCEKLSEITIPETVYSIGELAFYGCKSLKSIVLPEALTVLGDKVFQNCTALESVEIKSDITTIPTNMFTNCQSLTSFKSAQQLRVIREKAFYNCKKLEYIDLGRVHTMEGYAFAYCDSLKEVKLTYLDDIPERAFLRCYALSSVTFTKWLKTVGTCAFAVCSSLESVVLPENVTTVSTGAFANCKNLKEVTVESDSISISTGLTTSDGVKYRTLPENAVIKANPASKADAYADTYNMSFVPLTEKEISSVTLTGEPAQLIYAIGKDTQFSKSGAAVKVKYADGTSITLKNRFTVDWKDADITKRGTYTPCIVYGDYSFPFEIRVVENYIYSGIPEGRVLGEIFCPKNEITAVCFIPTETGEYTFAFDKGKDLEITADATVVERGDIKVTLAYTYEKGKEYYFYITPTSADSTVRLSEMDDIYFSPLSDGTYEARLSIKGGDIVIPAEYGGAPVTKIADRFCSNSVLHFNPVKEITVSEGIKEIGKEAFKGHKYNVILPSSLEKIGDYAFENWGYGESLTLPSGIKAIGNYAFSNAYELREVTFLSDRDITFGDYVFNSCERIKTVNFNENITSVGKNMFRDCERFKTLTGTDGINKIGSYAFYNCIVFESDDFISQAYEIGAYAFCNCPVKDVVFNENLIEIPERAFNACKEIEKITVPDSVTYIGDYAFVGCSALNELALGNRLKEIGQHAFYGAAFETLVLPDSLEKLGNGCFSECDNIKEIVLPKKIDVISGSAFSRCDLLEKISSEGSIKEIQFHAFIDCKNLKEVTFLDTVEKVGHNAFEGCISLEKADFGKVNYIDDKAFYGCTSLESVTLPMENTYIGDSAFAQCTSLKEINIPEAGTLKNTVFSGCTSLRKVTIGERTALGENVLNFCSGLKELHLYAFLEPGKSLGNLPEGDVTVYGYPGGSAEKLSLEKLYEFIAVDGHSHTFTMTRVEPKKCFEYTKLVYTCSCGYSYSENERLLASTHYYGDFIVDKAPTCTEYGLKSRHCYCGKTRKDTTLIEPLGHTEVIDLPAEVPSKTEAGYTHQSHCSVCENVVVERELIDPKEYDIQIEGGTVTAQKLDVATADSDGADVTITFELKNNVYLSHIDRTVICKVGEVKLTKTKFTYNGKVQKPAVSVKDSKGENLVLNRDYRVTYSADSKYSGKYRVRVDYIGNYAGGKLLYYDIVIDSVIPQLSSATAGSIALSWKKGHSDLAYRVYSADSKGNLKIIADTKNGSYTVSSLKSGTEYRYLVRAYVKDAKGKIYWGDEGKALLCSTAPAGVSKLSVSSGTKSVKLSWKKVTGATGYRIYKYDGSWKTVKDTKSLSCKITGLKSGRTYKFYVRPYKQLSGRTLWSADNKSDAVQTCTKPSATSKITFKAYTDSIKLSWKKVSGATGYRIYVYDNLDDKYIKVTDTTKTSYTVKKKNGKKLKPGVQYKFRVKAYIKKNGKTYWSDSYKAVKTATKPSKPSLTVKSSKGKVNLSWKNVAGESGYQVYYAAKKDGKYKKLISTKANKVKYSKKLTKGKKYYFKVRAYKKVGSKTVYGSFSSVRVTAVEPNKV